jgi:hypothetical protein
MLGAWATGDLLTAAVLPIIMNFGHVLEERSVIGMSVFGARPWRLWPSPHSAGLALPGR